jgi:hypothetical protein
LRATFPNTALAIYRNTFAGLLPVLIIYCTDAATASRLPASRPEVSTATEKPFGEGVIDYSF